jgi:hypothetical protein
VDSLHTWFVPCLSRSRSLCGAHSASLPPPLLRCCCCLLFGVLRCLRSVQSTVHRRGALCLWPCSRESLAACTRGQKKGKRISWIQHHTVPGWSPTPVLSGLKPRYLRCSDENRWITVDMVESEDKRRAVVPCTKCCGTHDRHLTGCIFSRFQGTKLFSSAK